jgi:hypothetical protein
MNGNIRDKEKDNKYTAYFNTNPSACLHSTTLNNNHHNNFAIPSFFSQSLPHNHSHIRKMKKPYINNTSPIKNKNKKAYHCKNNNKSDDIY